MASRGINKCIIIGNLGKDPEVRYMPNGNAVANFTVATSESWKDQQGQQQEKTEWHNIVMYKRLAEVAGEYLKKGSKVYLEGKLQTSKWQDQATGQDKYKTEINCSQMQMLDSKGQTEGHVPEKVQKPTQQQAPAQQQAPQQAAPAQQVPAQQAPVPKQPTEAEQRADQQQGQPSLDEGWDDDIPF